MTPTLYFDTPGNYHMVAQPDSPCRFWLRDVTGEAEISMQVNSPEHASQFANVFVQDGNSVRRLPRKERGQ